MASKGETVKYVIDADTSGFARGMAEAALESDVAGKKIDKNLSKTAKSSENNFKDIRTGAAKTASQIRNFGVALQGFNVTSAILGITALSGAILELSGAIAAAGSTTVVLVPALVQAGAAAETFKTGVSGLGAAFKAIGKNDGKAFAQSLSNLGPAATQVALAAGALNKAFNGIRLNVQNALLADMGQTMLTLGAEILPTLNAGMQRVAQSFNAAFKSAAALASTPVFQGLLATIFADTATNVGILSGVLAPLLTIFTNLYLVTRPYVTLLAQSLVSLTKQAAAYLGSAKGQTALNIAIQEGIIAIKELAGLVGAAFGVLTSIFRTGVNGGNSMIVTLTGILKATENWINSATGQADLAALFNFTSLAIQNVARSIGIASQLFFGIIKAVDSLSPGVQTLLINFLSLALAVAPISGYFLRLFGSFKLVGLVIFNLIQQLFVVFAALGAVGSVALVLAGGLIILGAIIKGPLGGALILIGSVIAAYIALSFLLAGANTVTAGSLYNLGFAAIEAAATQEELAAASTLAYATMYQVAAAGLAAGEGEIAAATGASILQAALLPVLVAAAGLVVILSMLGVFGGKAKQAGGASIDLSSSLGSLQKAMKGVGATGTKTSNKGLSALNDSLNSVGDASAAATGSLASFDKMNVLTDNSAAGAGISGLPALPDVGGGGGFGVPPLDTGDFDKSLADMTKNFDKLKMDLDKGVTNPFAAIGDWINAHPWIALTGFVIILGLVGAAFLAMAIFEGFAISPLLLIVIAVVAIIAIIIILAKNWGTIWAGIQDLAAAAGQFLQGVWNGIVAGAQAVGTAIGNFFSAAWDAIKVVWGVVVAFFGAIFSAIGTAIQFYIQIYITAFKLAWAGIQIAFSAAVGFFQGIWNGISAVFGVVGTFFAGVFNAAWNAIKAAFGAVGGFFQSVWNTITGIFGSIGTTIGNAIGGAFKSVINTIINVVADFINGTIKVINGAIGLVNKLPGVHVGTISLVTLPHLARGGLITSPTVAQLGEDGEEAVMPLQNNTGWIDMLAGKINAANGSGNGQPLNLTVQIGEDKVANKIIDLINEKTQMSGRNTILV